MICPKCKQRHAPFPKDDFEFVSGKGYVAKNSEAETRRSNLFNSDYYEYCGCEDEDWIYEEHYPRDYRRFIN